LKGFNQMNFRIKELKTFQRCFGILILTQAFILFFFDAVLNAIFGYKYYFVFFFVYYVFYLVLFSTEAAQNLETRKIKYTPIQQFKKEIVALFESLLKSIQPNIFRFIFVYFIVTIYIEGIVLILKDVLEPSLEILTFAFSVYYSLIVNGLYLLFKYVSINKDVVQKTDWRNLVSKVFKRVFNVYAIKRLYIFHKKTKTSPKNLFVALLLGISYANVPRTLIYVLSLLLLYNGLGSVLAYYFLFVNIITYILTHDKVKSAVKTQYGSNSLRLMGWNTTTNKATAVAKGVTFAAGAAWGGKKYLEADQAAGTEVLLKEQDNQARLNKNHNHHMDELRTQDPTHPEKYPHVNTVSDVDTKNTSLTKQLGERLVYCAKTGEKVSPFASGVFSDDTPSGQDWKKNKNGPKEDPFSDPNQDIDPDFQEDNDGASDEENAESKKKAETKSCSVS